MSKVPVILKAPRLYTLFVPLMLVLILLGGVATWRLHITEPPANVMPINPALEEKYGIRFTFLAVTADGGLLDLRYRVLDVGKAKNFGHYTETTPMLIAEDSGRTVQTTAMGMHNHRVEAGYTYHILYRNTANAIKSGSKVTVAIGDLKLEHFPAH
ncbi:MAG: hypothetical protein ACETWR_10290 [Anaerolineae bacterium]|jgi:hypothetical protein